MEKRNKMVLAIPKHICDEHSFPENKYFKECKHGNLSNKQFLASGHRAASNIETALRGYNNCHIRNLDKFVSNLMTTENEVFNKLLSILTMSQNMENSKL